MFNLDRAIADWRRQMMTAGIKAPEVLDELESHLRDDIEQQIHSGANDEQAFRAAVARVGEARMLKFEFAKVAEHSCRPGLLKVGFVICAACMLLINVGTLLLCELSLLERVLGFAAVSFICLYVAGLPRLLKALPTQRLGWLAKWTKGASSVMWLWPIWALLEAGHIVHSGMGLVPVMVLWCLYAAFAMTIVALGQDGRFRRPGSSGDTLPPLQPGGPRIPTPPSCPPEFAVPLPPSKPVDPMVQQSFEAACAEARRRGHDYIGTEHVLLGLLQRAKGSFASALARMGVDPEAVRAEVERLVSPTPAQARSASIPFTPRARRAIHLAIREAKALRQPRITAEHVFLGLLREGGGVAALALRKLGIRIERARAEIRRSSA